MPDSDERPDVMPTDETDLTAEQVAHMWTRALPVEIQHVTTSPPSPTTGAAVGIRSMFVAMTNYVVPGRVQPLVAPAVTTAARCE
jgi:hypothetical protein